MAREDEGLPDPRELAAKAAGGEEITETGVEAPVVSESASSVAEASAESTVEGGSAEAEDKPWFLELGPEYEGLSEEQAIARLEQERAQLSRLPEIEAQARRAQELEAYLRQQQQQLAAWQYQQQVAAQQAQQKEQQTKAQAKIPEWKSEWREGIEVNEKGQIVAKSGYDPTLPQKYLARQAYEREQLSRFTESPAAFVMEHVQEQIQQAIDARVQQHLAQYADMQAQKDFEASNSNWLYHDPDTKQQLTSYGQEFAAIVNSLQQSGIPRLTAFATAKREMVSKAIAQKAQQQAQGVAPAANPNGNEQFLRRAAATAAPKPGASRTNGRAKKEALPVGPGGMPDIKRMLESDFRNANIDLNSTVALS